MCPACHAKELKYHSRYNKFHFRESIVILVFKCQCCQTHHSLLPTFSLPGTSLGTKEVEDYIRARNKKVSRKEAGATLMNRGITEKHLKNIERLVDRCINRYKTLFANQKIARLSGIEWAEAFLKEVDFYFDGAFIMELNLYCIGHRVNATFCSRKNILLFSKKKPGLYFSNDIDPYKGSVAILDSS